jgi:hypothetical protein
VFCVRRSTFSGEMPRGVERPKTAENLRGLRQGERHLEHPGGRVSRRISTRSFGSTGSIQAILDTTFEENASETLSSVKTGTKTGAPVANKKQKQFIKDNTSIAHLSQGTQKKLLQILYDNFEAVSYGEFDLGNCQTTKQKLFLKTCHRGGSHQHVLPRNPHSHLRKQATGGRNHQQFSCHQQQNMSIRMASKGEWNGPRRLQ